MRDKPLTVYPQSDVRRELQRIADEDHGRPVAHMAEIALKAFLVQWSVDKYAALRLADQFGAPVQR